MTVGYCLVDVSKLYTFLSGLRPERDRMFSELGNSRLWMLCTTWIPSTLLGLYRTKKFARIPVLSLTISGPSWWTSARNQQTVLLGKNRRQQSRSLNNKLKKWSQRITSTSMCWSSSSAFYLEMICHLWPLLANHFLQELFRGSIARYHIRSVRQRDIQQWVNCYVYPV